MVPFYTVKNPGFKQLVCVFDKQYNLPSSKYFSQTAIPLLYNIRDKVAEEISKVEYFSATTDLWSSEGMKPYLSYGHNLHRVITNSIKCDDNFFENFRTFKKDSECLFNVMEKAS